MSQICFPGCLKSRLWFPAGLCNGASWIGCTPCQSNHWRFQRALRSLKQDLERTSTSQGKVYM
eukprot:2799458-Amphidinium_carterae.1